MNAQLDLNGSVALIQDRFFAGGNWVRSASEQRIEIISPTTEEVVGSVPDCNEADVNVAVAGARKAFEEPGGWSTWTPARRADALDALAAELDSRQDELATLQAHQVGRPIASRGGGRPGEILRYFAQLARTHIFVESRESAHDRGPQGLQSSTILWEPRGVTAAITPYNGALSLGLYKIAPSLAAGGTAVFKPPPQSPLDAYVLAEAVRAAGLPPGVLAVVPGGQGTGEALVRHADIDIVGFTGSTSVGRKIAATCGALLRPVILELGGKSAAVVLEDADLTAFEAALPFIGFTFSGQNCFIHSRIVVVEPLYDDVVKIVSRVAQRLTLGDPFNSTTDLGPLVSQAHRDFIQRSVDEAVAQGAKVETGGNAPALPAQGWFFEPTVLSGVTTDMSVSRTELFGPVLSIMKAHDEREAFDIADDTDFGLGGSVWSADAERAAKLSLHLDTGTVGLNGFGFNTAAPFECRRDSGLGVELGPEGLRAYLRPRVIQHFGVSGEKTGA